MNNIYIFIYKYIIAIANISPSTSKDDSSSFHPHFPVLLPTTISTSNTLPPPPLYSFAFAFAAASTTAAAFAATDFAAAATMFVVSCCLCLFGLAPADAWVVDRFLALDFGPQFGGSSGNREIPFARDAGFASLCWLKSASNEGSLSKIW